MQVWELTIRYQFANCSNDQTTVFQGLICNANNLCYAILEFIINLCQIKYKWIHS